jgi:hypothetical protein
VSAAETHRRDETLDAAYDALEELPCQSLFGFSKDFHEPAGVSLPPRRITIPPSCIGKWGALWSTPKTLAGLMKQ